MNVESTLQKVRAIALICDKQISYMGNVVQQCGNPLHFGVTSDGAFKLVRSVDFTPEKSCRCSFSGI